MAGTEEIDTGVRKAEQEEGRTDFLDYTSDSKNLAFGLLVVQRDGVNSEDKQFRLKKSLEPWYVQLTA